MAYGSGAGRNRAHDDVVHKMNSKRDATDENEGLAGEKSVGEGCKGIFIKTK